MMGACVAVERDTATNGTQPTGMHSCFPFYLFSNSIFFEFFSVKQELFGYICLYVNVTTIQFSTKRGRCPLMVRESSITAACNIM